MIVLLQVTEVLKKGRFPGCFFSTWQCGIVRLKWYLDNGATKKQLKVACCGKLIGIAMALSLHFRRTMLHGPIANNTEQAECKPLPFPRCFQRFAGETEDERTKIYILP